MLKVQLVKAANTGKQDTAVKLVYIATCLKQNRRVCGAAFLLGERLRGSNGALGKFV